jgi:hypothetical protein
MTKRVENKLTEMNDIIVEKIYENQALLSRICFSFYSGEADREDLFQ